MSLEIIGTESLGVRSYTKKRRNGSECSCFVAPQPVRQRSPLLQGVRDSHAEVV